MSMMSGTEDATGKLEKLAEETAERHNRFAEEVLPTVVNRPLGSHVLTPHEEFMDYLKMQDDPNGWGNLWQKLISDSQGDTTKALLALTRYHKRMSGMVSRRLKE